MFSYQLLLLIHIFVCTREPKKDQKDTNYVDYAKQ
jgi:hypothetical protein